MANEPETKDAAAQPGTNPELPATPTPEPSSKLSEPPTVRVEGLTETLARVRHELDLIGHASVLSSK